MSEKIPIGKLSLQDYEQLLEKAAKELDVPAREVQKVIYHIGLTSGEPVDEKRMKKFTKFVKVAQSSVAEIRKAIETPGLVPPWLVKQASYGQRRAFFQRWIRGIKKAKVSMMEYRRILSKLEKNILPFGDEKDVLRRSLEIDEKKLEYDRFLKMKNLGELNKIFFSGENDPKIPLGENYHPSVGWY